MRVLLLWRGWAMSEQSAFDWPGVPFVVGSDTSAEAAEMLRPSAATLRAEVFRAISNSLGLTCDELEVCLDMRHQTCSARVCELHQRGMIVDTGRRRPTRSGRPAAVYVVPSVCIRCGHPHQGPAEVCETCSP